jgi:hypothetical protein
MNQQQLLQLLQMVETHLPKEVQNHIYEYNSEHRRKMYWCHHYFKNNMTRCDLCEKIIIGDVYSRSTPFRRYDGDEPQCCSVACLDELEWRQSGYYDGDDEEDEIATILDEDENREE